MVSPMKFSRIKGQFYSCRLLHFLSGFIFLSPFTLMTLQISFSSLPTLTYLNREKKEKTGSQELSYATVQKMEYLDQVVKETLRLYPPAPSVIRRQTAEEVQLKVPEGSVRVSKIIPKFPVTCDWARANLYLWLTDGRADREVPHRVAKMWLKTRRFRAQFVLCGRMFWKRMFRRHRQIFMGLAIFGIS